MSTLRQSLRNPAYAYGSVTMLLFFASWGIWWSFFQIWLTSEAVGLQLNGSQIGIIYAANSAAALVLTLLYGVVQDRLDLRRGLLITVSAIMATIGPFAIYVYRPLLATNFALGVFLGAVVLTCGFLSACPLFEAFVERLSRRNGFEYGQARMWGSFGYAGVALLAGFLFTINPNLNFWIGSAFGVMMLLIQLFWRPTRANAPLAGQAPPRTPSFAEMFALLRSPSLWAVIVFVLFSWTFYTVFDQQMFPDFYTSLFETDAQGERTYGILNSGQVFLEAMMMGVVPLIMRRVGVRNTLLLGVVVMCVRIGGCAVLDGPVAISGIKLLHAIEVPLFVLGIFRYFTLHFDTALSATLYLVGFNFASQVGSVLMSQPLGALRDSIGYQPTFLVIAGVVALSMAFAFLVLKRDDQHVHGDPFIPNQPSTSA